jgi:hypothetical protein
MLFIPGVSPTAISDCLGLVATLLIAAAGLALMVGLRKLAVRLGMLAVLVVMAVAGSAPG